MEAGPIPKIGKLKLNRNESKCIQRQNLSSKMDNFGLNLCSHFLCQFKTFTPLPFNFKVLNNFTINDSIWSRLTVLWPNNDLIFLRCRTKFSQLSLICCNRRSTRLNYRMSYSDSIKRNNLRIWDIQSKDHKYGSEIVHV